jgi:steroid delta-isomerase-like uncharacterized protein
MALLGAMGVATGYAALGRVLVIAGVGLGVLGVLVHFVIVAVGLMCSAGASRGRTDHDVIYHDGPNQRSAIYPGMTTADRHTDGVARMTADEMKALVRHIMEDGFNKQDMDVVHAAFTTDYVRHGHGVGSMGSLAEHVEDLLSRHQAFSDAKFTINTILAEGDTVAVRYTFTGVHTGEFNGIPATGKSISRESAAFFTIKDGKVAVGHVFADGAGLLAQLNG